MHARCRRAGAVRARRVEQCARARVGGDQRIRDARHAPNVRDDLLAQHDHEPAWLAFVRAVRQLPRQQLEAVLLHYGEHLNDRYLGVAMDCSADAAHAHLDAARATLRDLGPANFDPATQKLAAAHVRLGPAAADVPAEARLWAARALRPRRLRRLITWLAALTALAAAAWLTRGWWAS
jgi:hypothetical protein